MFAKKQIYTTIGGERICLPKTIHTTEKIKNDRIRNCLLSCHGLCWMNHGGNGDLWRHIMTDVCHSQSSRKPGSLQTSGLFSIFFRGPYYLSTL